MSWMLEPFVHLRLLVLYEYEYELLLLRQKSVVFAVMPYQDDIVSQRQSMHLVIP
jgi:hypothetical protein